MSKIFNNRLKGKQLATSQGLIQFNAEGVANISNEELVEKLLELKGYTLVEGSEKSSENLDKTPKVEKTSDEKENTQKNDEDDFKSDEGNDNAEDKEKNDSDEENETKNNAEGDDGVWTEEKLAAIKNVAQLKKIAKDNNIDLQGATKSDEIKAIIIGAFK